MVKDTASRKTAELASEILQLCCKASITKVLIDIVTNERERDAGKETYPNVLP